VSLKILGRPEVIRFKASGEADGVLAVSTPEFQNEMNVIADAVHQAYMDSTKESFFCYSK
jgi:hypothetical protein